jgi:hypothetical protein
MQLAILNASTQPKEIEITQIRDLVPGSLTDAVMMITPRQTRHANSNHIPDGPTKSSRFFNGEMQRFFNGDEAAEPSLAWRTTTQYWPRPLTRSIPTPRWRVSSFTNARALR